MPGICVIEIADLINQMLILRGIKCFGSCGGRFLCLFPARFVEMFCEPFESAFAALMAQKDVHESKDRDGCDTTFALIESTIGQCR